LYTTKVCRSWQRVAAILDLELLPTGSETTIYLELAGGAEFTLHGP
jgi:hypothetical protein